MDDIRNTDLAGAAGQLSVPPAGKGSFSPLPMLFLAVTGLITFVCLCVDLCADDYFYGTFLQDGFDHFLAQNIEHYETFNGRVQVHLVLQVVLRLGLPAYALVCVTMLLLLPLLGRWAAGLERGLFPWSFCSSSCSLGGRFCGRGCSGSPPVSTTCTPVCW